MTEQQRNQGTVADDLKQISERFNVPAILVNQTHNITAPRELFDVGQEEPDIVLFVRRVSGQKTRLVVDKAAL